MISSDDILSLLRAGSNPDDVAHDLITAMNDALETYNKEQGLQKEREENKRRAVAALLDSATDILRVYYPDLWDDNYAKFLSPDKVVKYLDNWQNEFQKIKETTERLRDAFKSAGERD